MLAYPQACTPMSHQLLVKPNDVRHDRVLLLSLSLYLRVHTVGASINKRNNTTPVDTPSIKVGN